MDQSGLAYSVALASMFMYIHVCFYNTYICTAYMHIHIRIYIIYINRLWCTFVSNVSSYEEKLMRKKDAFSSAAVDGNAIVTICKLIKFALQSFSLSSFACKHRQECVYLFLHNMRIH